MVRTAIASRVAGERMANYDLEELVDVLLGTGCRLGEALAIRPRDLTDLGRPPRLLHVCADARRAP